MEKRSKLVKKKSPISEKYKALPSSVEIRQLAAAKEPIPLHLRGRDSIQQS